MARNNNRGGPVTADTPLKPGDTLQAKWAGMWWPAEVVEVLERGRVKIHYTGWDAQWDEAVPRSRLRLGGPGARPAPRALAPPVASPLPPGPVWMTPLDRLLRGLPVTDDTPLEPGDAVVAEWLGVWWPAEVVALRDDGQVLIRYPGWGDAWDEVVPRGRLALDVPGTREVTVHFDAGWSVRGRLVEFQQDALVLEAPDGRRLFVNKQRVAYWEVTESGRPRQRA